ncbi:MAG: FecR domain-containing protein [Gimesia sp.]|nr:FecR domain-containing protein [Gimesia sp.]
MEPINSQKELYELFDALFSNEISAEKHLQLQHQLENDPQARQSYYDYLDVLQGLGTLSQAQQDILAVSQLPNHSLDPTASVTETRAQRAPQPYLKYLSVIVASAVMVLGIEWWVVDRSSNSKQSVEITQESATPVATMVRSRDCQWSGEQQPKFEGHNLLTRELSLEQGVAELRFDSGVRLVIEGPTKLRIDSSTSATVSMGRVVLHGHELAEEFELTTPRAKLYDIGTEYGTSVDEAGNVEVHVFDGAVRIQENKNDLASNNPVIIQAGAAKQIGQDSSSDIALAPERFKRETSDQPPGAEVTPDELIAYDSFGASEKLGTDKKPEWRNAGIGWNNNWRLTVDDPRPADGSCLTKTSLVFPRAKTAARTGALKMGASKNAWRSLKKPIRMDLDAIYYLSFFINKSKKLPESETQYGSISLRTLNWPRDGRKLLFGMDSSRYTSLSHNREPFNVAPKLQVDKNYFFAVKIVASKKSPDQIFLRVYTDEDSDIRREPLVWTLYSKPKNDDSVFDQVLIHAGGKGEYIFDELRIGHTWNSVTNFKYPKLPGEKAVKKTAKK